MKEVIKGKMKIVLRDDNLVQLWMATNQHRDTVPLEPIFNLMFWQGRVDEAWQMFDLLESLLYEAELTRTPIAMKQAADGPSDRLPCRG